MADITVADLEQLYTKTLVLYKGKPVHIQGVTGDRKIHIVDVSNKRKDVVPYERGAITPIRGRIGFVNHNGHALYIQRRPARRYQVGINLHNSKLDYLQQHRFHPTLSRAIDQVGSFAIPGFAASVNNIYPSLAEAIAIAKSSGGSCAFDKQFAVDSSRRIFYKTSHVGNIPARCSTVKRIVFIEGFEFLQTLIEPCYEKTVRTFEAA